VKEDGSCILCGVRRRFALAKKRFYDITMTIENGMLSWPSDGPVRIEKIRSMDNGERLNLSRLDMSAHTGTHVDAPVHFIQEGSGIESVPLDILIGPAAVVHLPGVREIGAGELKAAGIPPDTQRLLLKTENGKLLGQKQFKKDYSFFTLEGAQYIIDSGVRLVGIDYLSIAAYGSGEAVHQALLGEGIVIIEGVDLREVSAGPYNMIALPLKIDGCDGAPARVVLEKMEEGIGNRE
jgi:arylformamidase